MKYFTGLIILQEKCTHIHRAKERQYEDYTNVSKTVVGGQLEWIVKRLSLATGSTWKNYTILNACI
jgi:hypothetical protein